MQKNKLTLCALTAILVTLSVHAKGFSKIVAPGILGANYLTASAAEPVVVNPGKIDVTDTIVPDNDFNMPFGDVVVGLSPVEQITINNTDPDYGLTINQIFLSNLWNTTVQNAEVSVMLPAVSPGSRSSVLSYPPAEWITPERPAAQMLVPSGYRMLTNSIKVLLLVSGSDPSILRTALQAFPDIEDVNYYNCSYNVPQASELAPYDVVVVMSSRSFSNAYKTGNTLADYIDDGGKVVQAVATFATGGRWELKGRFVAEDYGPFSHGPGEFFRHNLGGFNVDHPIMTSVTELSDGGPAAVSLKTDAVWVADWDNGTPLVATKDDNVVGINIFAFNYGDFAGDVPLLFHNAFVWLLDIVEGFKLSGLPSLPITIPPSESIDIDVVFIPKETKEYKAKVVIESNDDDEPKIEVRLTGTGILDYLQVAPDEISVFYRYPDSAFIPTYNTYELTNIGPVTIDFTSEPNVPWLDVFASGGTLSPGESTTISVSPNSQAMTIPQGRHCCDVIFTNSTTTLEHSRKVCLYVYTEPKIWADPCSFNVTLPQSQKVTRILTLGNSGASPLQFSLSGQQVSFMPSLEQGPVGGLVMETEEIEAFQLQKNDLTYAADIPFAPGEILVRFVPDNSETTSDIGAKFSAIRTMETASVKREYQIVPGLYRVKLPEGITVSQAVAEFNKDDSVLYAQPNYKIWSIETLPDDPYFSDLWGMHNTGQTGGTVDADIDAPEAWDITTGDGSVIVAVIDTGVDYTHPDLAPNMWVNEDEFNGIPAVDDDGNGYVDDIYGYDFCNNDGDPMDDHFHGTHCAGTIGAVGNNNQGVAGLCWDVRIMALKFLDSSGSGTSADAITAIEYSVLMGAKLSSNSWGGTYYDQALKDAIDAAGQAGLLFVASAGNSSADTDFYPHYPSGYDSQSIVSVLATNHYDNRAGFSNFGLTTVDLGAPGLDILSCAPGNNYRYLDGTSMAAPHISGACGLLWSVCPSMTNLDVKNILLQTVDPTLPGFCVSSGRLNVFEALLEAEASCQPPWLGFIPSEGDVAVGDSVNVNVVFNAGQAPGTYQGLINILSNDTYVPELTIPVTMNIKPFDYFTELFEPCEPFPMNIGIDPNRNDLAYRTLTFRPDGSGEFYRLCVDEANDFPVDPNDGIVVSLQDNDYKQVQLEGAYINLYGRSYEDFYIASNGYISFISGDIRDVETLIDHFELPRISALFDDLDPSAGGIISFKQLDDRVVVTFEDVPEYGLFNSNSFQIEMRFNGKIRITFLNIDAADGLVGLSNGDRLPAYFEESDLSGYDSCSFAGDLNSDIDVDFEDFAVFAEYWQNKYRQVDEEPMYVRDEFKDISYSGNDGNKNFSSNWHEIGESDGPYSGKVQVTSAGQSNALRIGKKAWFKGAKREVDLSGAVSATLTFDWQRSHPYFFNKAMVDISSDGGLTWTTLMSIRSRFDKGLHSESFDISDHIAPHTQIRFKSFGWANGYIYFDNIQIEYVGPEEVPWCGECDFTSDWKIDSNDLLILFEHWLD